MSSAGGKCSSTNAWIVCASAKFSATAENPRPSKLGQGTLKINHEINCVARATRPGEWASPANLIDYYNSKIHLVQFTL